MKTKKNKTVNIFGKAVPMAILVVLAVSGIGMAALLTYYGTITAAVTVQQSILVDGLSDPLSQAITDGPFEPAPGGESFCFGHSLKNQMSVAGTVNFASDCSKDGYADNCGGITKNYYESVAYSYTGTIAGVGVKVEDTGDSLKWTYTYATSPTHTPKMTVAINYPTGYAITTFDDGSHDSWYYAPDGGAEVYLGPYAGGTNGWATTTASGNVLTVKILKSHLGSSFKWHGYANYNGAEVWINGHADGLHYGEPPFTATFIGGALTLPVTIPSKTTTDFYICYGFAPAIAPGIYTITTNVVPA